MVDEVLVNRLIEALGIWDPWGVDFDWSHVITSELDGSVCQSETDPLYQDPYYHGARVAHFQREGIEEPIVVDTATSGDTILSHPVMIDGWHRLLAAHLREDRTIPVYFGGRVNLLEWLMGLTDTAPED